MKSIPARAAASAALFLLVAVAAFSQQEPILDEFTFHERLKTLHSVPPEWERISLGLDRTVLRFEGEGIVEKPFRHKVGRKVEMIVYRIDTCLYPLRVVTAREVLNRPRARLRDVHKKAGALLTINGGFFYGSGEPVGLVISGGKVYSNYHEDGGSGAIAIYGDIIRIGWAINITMADPQPDYALQNGPLLIDPGGSFGINAIREVYSHRTIVGLDEEGKLLIGVTKKIYAQESMSSGLNLFEAASIFHNPAEIGGLAASVALNLDGGTSTGLEFELGEHHDRVKVGIDLPDFLCIMPGK